MENKSFCIVESSASERNNLNLAADGAKCLFLERLVGEKIFWDKLKDLFILRPCSGGVC